MVGAKATVTWIIGQIVVTVLCMDIVGNLPNEESLTGY
jgi:hypothetical protein